MNQNITPREHPLLSKQGFPLRIFAATFVISITVTIFGGWQTWQIHQRSDDLSRRHVALTGGIGRIMQLDEALTMSARMAAATGDFSYEKRYDQLDPQLSREIEAVRAMLPQADMAPFVSATDEANLALVGMERQAFALAHQGKRKEATALLTNTEYLRLKNIYAIGMEMTARSANVLIQKEGQNLHNLSVYLAAANSVGVLALLAAWLFAVRSARAWVTERKQAEMALRQAHGELEARVEQRTADLVHINEQLQRKILEHKASKGKVKILTQLYAALSHCNQAIVRCTDDESLFRQICLDAVQFGGFKMVWIGLVDEASNRVNPVASYGEGTEYLQDIQISVDADSPWGHGPMGIAIREDRPFWCQDFSNDTATAQWHETAARFGWGASASLPLHRENAVIGTLTLYSETVGAFDEAVCNLLVEIATDISFALNNFVREAERDYARNKLTESLQHFRAVTETASDAIINSDDAGNIISWNTAASRMFGYAWQEVNAQPLTVLMSEPYRKLMGDKLDALASDEDANLTGKSQELEGLNKSGKEFPLELSLAKFHTGKGCFFTAVIRDITERKQSEASIRESQLRFSTIFKQSPIGIALIDSLSGKIYQANSKFAEIAGRNIEEMETIDWMSITHPDDVQGDLDNMALMNDGKIPGFSMEKRYRRPDGAFVWINMTVAPLKLERNGAPRHLAMIEDITRRKHTEEQLRKLALAVEQSPESIAITNLNADIEYVNEAFLRSTGYSHEEVIGQNPRMLQSSNTPKQTYIDMWKALTGGIPWKGEFFNKRKDGSEYVEFAIIMPLRMPGGSISHYVAVKEDVTEKKRMGAELDKHRHHLESLVELRTHELEAAKRMAETANKAKSDFLAAMSHEIRTPMNGVIGMIDVLQQSNLNPQQVKVTNIIHDSAFALLAVIDDILDFSKIEAGKLSVESMPVNLESIVDGVCATLDQMALLKEVELTQFVDATLPAQLISDPVRLRQILVNLVNNAIKFSCGQERQAKVAVRVIRADGKSTVAGMLEFCVSDNGIGMDEETQARLFTPFTQADVGTTRTYGGTGLGLVISRRLANLLGGEISVRSAPGKGSEFTVHLPFTPVAVAAESGQAPPQLAGLSCLLVGGKQTLTEDFASYLAHDGASVERVASLSEAQQWIANRLAGVHVVIFESACRGPYSLDGLRAAAAARPELDIRFVVIGRGRRRHCRRELTGDISVDGNILPRAVFLNVVAIAAGRSVDQCLNRFPGGDQMVLATITAMTREDARRQGRLILIAEDNEINQKVIQQQLTLLGHTSDVANNGREALERWQSGDYSLLFSDLHMPEMDGYELAQAIRAAESGKAHIPIIAFTANALKGEDEHCRAIGMDDYLSKPVQLTNLKAMLEKWLPDAKPVSTDGATQSIPDAIASHPDATASVPVDVNVLKALVGDDAATIADFLHDFSISAGKIALELRAAHMQGNASAVGALAHKLKSSARSVGALALGELCAEMEKAGKSGDNNALGMLMPKFEQELALVEQYLGG